MRPRKTGRKQTKRMKRNKTQKRYWKKRGGDGNCSSSKDIFNYVMDNPHPR